MVLAILRRRRGLILASVVALLAVSILYIAIVPAKYASTADIEVQNSSTDLLDLGNMMGHSGELGDSLNASLDLQTQVEILQSSALALRVVDDLHVEQSGDFQARWYSPSNIVSLLLPQRPMESASVPLSQAPARSARAVLEFGARLKVKPIPGTRLIELTYRSTDPRLAAAVVNDLTRSLVDYGFSMRNAATNQTSEMLSRQVADLKAQAEKQQARVVALHRDTGIYSLGEDSQGHDQVYSATLDQLQQATSALSTATSNRILKQAVYDTVKTGDPELISSLAGSSMGATSSNLNSLSLIQNLRGQQATAAAQLAQDESKFGSSYPKLADERSNLASTQSMIAAEVRRIGARAANDFKAAEATESQLRGVYDERKQQAQKLNDRAIEYAIVKQEADNSRQLFEDISKRLEEAGLLEGLRSSNIEVVSPGLIPVKPSPGALIILVAALLVGSFLGICAALFKEATDHTIHAMAPLELALGTSLLGVVPTLETGKGWWGLFSRKSQSPAGLSGGSGEAASVPYVIANPTSAFTEALRRLGVVVSDAQSSAPPKLILITSAVPGEGKTTIGSNLAALMAQAGKKVLFVEADMRQTNKRTALNTTYGARPGLSEVLAKGSHDSEVERPSSSPNMEIVPSGSATLHPAELLSTDLMQRLLVEWKNKFDCVILDSPPLLSVSDALILSRYADLTLVVARYGFTRMTSLERAVQMLASNSDSSIGVILNAAQRTSVDYEQYFGYNGSTYYQAQ